MICFTTAGHGNMARCMTLTYSLTFPKPCILLISIVFAKFKYAKYLKFVFIILVKGCDNQTRMVQKYEKRKD